MKDVFAISNEMTNKVLFHLSKEKKMLVFEEINKRLSGLKTGNIDSNRN